MAPHIDRNILRFHSTIHYNVPSHHSKGCRRKRNDKRHVNNDCLRRCTWITHRLGTILRHDLSDMGCNNSTVHRTSSTAQDIMGQSQHHIQHTTRDRTDRNRTILNLNQLKGLLSLSPNLFFKLLQLLGYFFFRFNFFPAPLLFRGFYRDFFLYCFSNIRVSNILQSRKQHWLGWPQLFAAAQFPVSLLDLTVNPYACLLLHCYQSYYF